MAAMPSTSRHRVFVWVLRIALFGLGLNFIVEWIRTGAYREPFDPRPFTEGNLLGILVSILISGIGAGFLLMLLGALVGPVTRHRGGWVALGLTVLGILAPLGGFGLRLRPRLDRMVGDVDATRWVLVGAVLLAHESLLRGAPRPTFVVVRRRSTPHDRAFGGS